MTTFLLEDIDNCPNWPPWFWKTIRK